MPSLTWKEGLRRAIRRLCAEKGSRHFSLSELNDFCLKELSAAHPENRSAEAAIRRELQVLRDEEFLAFEGRGVYVLLSAGDGEIGRMPGLADLLAALERRPHAREYALEAFALDRGAVRKVREKFGARCMLAGCDHEFAGGDGDTHDVHHIIPLFQGGASAWVNLSVLCAHHHRMAHFAAARERERIRKALAEANAEKLAATPTPTRP